MRNGSHGDDHRPVETPGRAALDVGLPHGDVAAAIHVTQRDAGIHERPLEGEGAAEEEGDEVVAPEGLNVRDLVGEHTVLVDPVARQVRAQIRPRGDADRLGRAHIRHLDERARPWIALAEEQEIVGVVPRQHGHVGLDEARPEAGGDPAQFAATHIGADLSRMTRINRHDGLRYWVWRASDQRVAQSTSEKPRASQGRTAPRDRWRHPSGQEAMKSRIKARARSGASGRTPCPQPGNRSKRTRCAGRAAAMSV